MEMDDLVLIPDFEIEEVDEIHDRMESNINDRYDKTEGQFPWDGPRTTAIEVQKEQISTQNMYYNGFLNASMDLLYMKLWSRRVGIDWKPAAKSSNLVTFKGVDGTTIPAGTIMQFIEEDAIDFISLEDGIITSGQAEIPFECAVGGTVGNIPANSLQLIEPITGVDSTEHTAFTNGVDEESKESLLKRTLERARNPGISGNVAHYREWAMSRVGVADAKVYPVWDGNNSVKVVLLDDNGQAPAQSIIDDVAQYIETVRPAGPKITVVGVTEIAIDVSAKVVPTSYSDVEKITKQFTPAALEYFKQLAFKDPLVRWTRIANILGDIPDVIDYESLTINGDTANIEIPDGSVAVLGTVNFYE
ncbi:baseplate J/gp47 family protein [Aneurinibacillus migulanus]|uniref:baseplate J/gp47 family protein n=1 Tax=Aneurinibacillus migulanus TaxID=47500 RepID=UPI00209C8115|nr:baseplate J/gp47 family protein [Aneurinibacillus migulanus]MCP1355096.1 baseplate J/gp47 family protein [Aneurinibacillus migulanus]